MVITSSEGQGRSPARPRLKPEKSAAKSSFQADQRCIKAKEHFDTISVQIPFKKGFKEHRGTCSDSFKSMSREKLRTCDRVHSITAALSPKRITDPHISEPGVWRVKVGKGRLSSSL